MSKWSRDSDEIERDIARALIIAEYHDDERAIDHIGRDW
jgi:hypothetical protein